MRYPGGRNYFQTCEAEVLTGLPGTLTEGDFEPYQKKMRNFLLQHPKALLGAFMGSGKTAIALNAFLIMKKRGKAKRLLVVAPYYVALDTWPTELLTWDFARSLSYSVVMGSRDNRLKALRTPRDVTIVNHENYQWLLETTGTDEWPWDTLVYDESSRLKSGTKITNPQKRDDGTKPERRLSRFGAVATTSSLFKRAWLLSGTPAAGGVIDLWGQIYVLDQGQRLGHKITHFRDRWFYYLVSSRRYIPRRSAEEQIMGRLKDIFWFFREEDYTELPPLQVVDRLVKLDEKHLKEYRKFERTLLLEEYDLEVLNSHTLVNKLLQFSNGSVYREELEEDCSRGLWKKKSVATYIHDRKLKELESIFEEAGGRPVLVAYSYRFDVQAIKKKFPWVRVYGETGHDLADWNEGKLRALVLHPASAGHGLNFQWGGNICVWFGLCWSLELYQQFNKRLHRRGQKESFVRLYRILADKTLDLRVARVLEEKGVIQDRVNDLVRVRMDEVEQESWEEIV